MDKKVNDGRRPRAAEGGERQLMVNDGRGSWEAEDGEHGKKIPAGTSTRTATKAKGGTEGRSNKPAEDDGNTREGVG
jgi:hypothetical protein